MLFLSKLQWYIWLTLYSNKIIGDAEYKFAAEFQQKDAYGRRALVQKSPEEVHIIKQIRKYTKINIKYYVVFITVPKKINYVSTNYAKLYFR